MLGAVLTRGNNGDLAMPWGSLTPRSSHRNETLMPSLTNPLCGVGGGQGAKGRGAEGRGQRVSGCLGQRQEGTRFFSAGHLDFNKSI
jgi:hypothetical protein